MVKEIMEGYVGVKFRPRQLSQDVPGAVGSLLTDFAQTCLLLKLHDMTPANGGNISVRVRVPGREGPSFVITASGCNLGCVEKSELIFVETFSVEEDRVDYRGPIAPSSESFLHGGIYQARPEVFAVIHAHDEFATAPELLDGVVAQTEQEEAYGTMELAQRARATIGTGRQIIVLKNHGYVAVGENLAGALQLILDTHNRLLEKKLGHRA